MENKIVKNDSKAYGYNYASLSDIAKQGFQIPKMKTQSDLNGNEYVYYFDGSEWQQGARVILFEQKGMNKAQLYGASLTYARRYTTLMALSLVCDDDKKLENSEEEKATEKQIDFLKNLYTEEELMKIVDHYQVGRPEDLPRSIVSQYIEDRNGKK